MRNVLMANFIFISSIFSREKERMKWNLMEYDWLLLNLENVMFGEGELTIR